MKRLSVAIVLVFVALLVMSIPALAITDPDTPPNINAVFVYTDCLETGDIGVFIDYFLDYAVTPTEPVTDAYLMTFVDSDGTTQLKTVAPYTYNDNGYGRGVVWIYFSAAEVTTYSIDIASILLYEIWFSGNPTLAWPGDPPKTTAGIDEWQTSGDTSVLVAQRVLYYADLLELAWSVDLIEQVASLGNRLTTNGQEYFENVITDLRDIAPACFADTTLGPDLQNLDYTTSFNATMTNGTGVVVGSPIDFSPGSTVVNVTGAGTFTFVLATGTSGNITNLTGTVTGSPVSLVAGTNTITVTVIGTFTVVLAQVDLTSNKDAGILGTALDLTAVATAFGMSRWFFSGIIWLIITVIVCAATYRVTSSTDGTFGGGGSAKPILLVFDICIIGGTVLGLMHPIVGILLFIGFGALTGYVLLFRGANI